MQTRIDEIAAGIYRLSVYVPDIAPPVGFTFNHFLIRAAEPMLFHCGLRAMFPTLSEAVGRLIPIEDLRWIGFGHVEADECGAMNEWLGVAPRAQVVHGATACMVSVNDLADRVPRTLTDGEVLDLGGRRVRYIDTPHVPHAWECGLMMDVTTRTFFCGDLFTQGGAGETPLTESDILGPSEAFRRQMDYYAHSPETAAILARLAVERPVTLACMHGSAWRGDGGKLLRELSAAVCGQVSIPA